MQTIIEKQLKFSFREGWTVSKFDEWGFYKGQFSRFGDAQILCKNCGGICRCGSCGTKRVAGTRGVDILAISPESACWLIEIKDYRLTRVTDFEFLCHAVALKVRDTLSCLVAARLNANNDDERDQARGALKCPAIYVVLHLERPPAARRLFAEKAELDNVRQKLRQLVQAVDLRPLVVSMNDMNDLQWTVAQV
jgi:hypothetical protein